MKILLIRFSSIGDIVLTSPIIRCVRNQFPNAEIHFLTKLKFKDVVASNPNINKFYYLEGDIQPIVLDLVKEKYDVIIDMQKSWRSNYVKSLLKQAFNSNVESFTFKKLNFKKWLLTSFKINLLPDKSIVERYFESVKPLGVKNDGQGLEFFIPSEDEIKKDDLPMSHSVGFVACAIGGQHATKKMPLEQWSLLCKHLPLPLVLLGGKEDADFAEELKKIDPVKVYNACGKFSLNESADIVRKSRIVITHDTGLMHIAAAFKKPIISIWGNTVPELGMFPYYGFNNLTKNVAPLSIIFENKKIKCRPCSKLGYKSCPKKHFKCMNSLDMLQLAAQAEKLYKEHK